MDAALKAIAEPHRRAILRLVHDGERSAGEIADQFEVSRPAISQHLRVLKDAGLIAERRDGTRRLYRTRPEAIAEIRTFLENFWTDALSDLKTLAEAEQWSKDSANEKGA
jgi:DNA-binding transcriptional ArsR family regulator